MKESINVAGLLTNVYSRSDLRNKNASSEPVVALFILHGRLDSSDTVDPTARAAFAWAAERRASSKQDPRDFVVVTFDMRNHGTRLVDDRANMGYSRKEEYHNERQAVDLYAMLLGAVKDVSFLIDVLPAYVFPHDERTIGEWVLSGFSLGGHATWIALRQEPRIRIGIPICGCPDPLALIERSAERHGVPLAPPYFPSSLRALICANANAAITTTATPGKPDGTSDHASASVYSGKSVLVLSGADDKIVPWEASRALVEAVDVGRSGRKEVVVVGGAKHELTEEMREEMFRFFWEEALVGDRTVAVQRSAL